MIIYIYYFYIDFFFHFWDILIVSVKYKYLIFIMIISIYYFNIDKIFRKLLNGLFFLSVDCCRKSWEKRGVKKTQSQTRMRLQL